MMAGLVSDIVGVLGRQRSVLLFVLALVAVTSGVAVVYTSHQTRDLYAGLEEVTRDRDLLESEYEKLLLERSAWSDLVRVERLSKRELAMRMPQTADVVVLVPDE